MKEPLVKVQVSLFSRESTRLVHTIEVTIVVTTFHLLNLILQRGARWSLRLALMISVVIILKAIHVLGKRNLRHLLAPLLEQIITLKACGCCHRLQAVKSSKVSWLARGSDY